MTDKLKLHSTAQIEQNKTKFALFRCKMTRHYFITLYICWGEDIFNRIQHVPYRLVSVSHRKFIICKLVARIKWELFLSVGPLITVNSLLRNM